jgi:hypothetical protein
MMAGVAEAAGSVVGDKVNSVGIIEPPSSGGLGVTVAALSSLPLDRQDEKTKPAKITKVNSTIPIRFWFVR